MKKILITGGAGFIGSNLAYRLLSQDDQVTLYDNLSRKMVKHNLKWLEENVNKAKLKIVIDDVRNKNSLNQAIKNQDVIFHLAAQTEVTASIKNPLEDFEINTIGTINLLEAVRIYNPEALAIYSSTNKVYGSMENLKISQNGVNESFPLDFNCPYACSKGAADQYFHDYNKIYGLKTIVFRQSCIYGSRQFGDEDQGWVMHFLKKILKGEEISIFGNGKQVRDILYIDDLIDVYLRAMAKIDVIKGSIYNIGGGAKFTVSLIELIKIIEKRFKKKASYSFHEQRPGDQKIFFCDNKKSYKELGWEAKIGINEGLDKLYDWIVQII